MNHDFKFYKSQVRSTYKIKVWYRSHDQSRLHSIKQLTEYNQTDRSRFLSHKSPTKLFKVYSRTVVIMIKDKRFRFRGR